VEPPVSPRRLIKELAELLAIEGRYTPGAGGALPPVESALSSLPLCPCAAREEPGCSTAAHAAGAQCGAPCRPAGGRALECDAGHVFAGTREQHADAEGALRAAQRRARAAHFTLVAKQRTTRSAS
jgi:hypothetical protein